LRKDGSTLECSATTARVGDSRRAPALVTVLHADRTADSAEARRAQERLDALGLFAGGIAHDFNNVLSIIRCNAEFARESLESRTPDVRGAIADVTEVERASERATALVRQLLAFGRRQPRDPKRIDLNTVVRDAVSLFRVSVGAEIQVVLRLAPELPPAHADRSQVEQVLMNLVFNARDAIVEAMATRGADGSVRPGVLTITTTAEHVDLDAVARTGVPNAGHYVRLDVRDTGVGMTEATRARIFEPFFTTKPVGGGTGLGLAATWGIVVQSGGSIRVETERLAGSTFRVYFPIATSNDGAEETIAAVTVPRPPLPMPAATPSAPRGDALEGGARTVLLAEDDHAVRRVASRILRNAGYRVLEAGDGGSALDLWRTHAQEVDVLVADVRMPRLRGDALAALVIAERADLPVVLMTGFGDEPVGIPSSAANGGQGTGLTAVAPLAKPFAAAELLGRVALALDPSATPADASAGVER
jgi:signal transduction histidine kinase/FixJ family two-component response regulator